MIHQRSLKPVENNCSVVIQSPKHPLSVFKYGDKWNLKQNGMEKPVKIRAYRKSCKKTTYKFECIEK